MGYDLVTNLQTCYIDVPSLLYYSHIPTAIIAFIIGLFVFWKNRHSLVSKILLFIGISFALWSAFDLIIWVNPDSRKVMFFWSWINLLEMLISVSTLYFSYVFLEKKDVSFNLKLFFSSLLTVFIIFIPSRLNLLGFDYINCESLQGPLLNYYYFLESFFSLWLLAYLIKKIKDSPRGVERKKTVYFSVGVVAFLFSFSGTNILSSALTALNINLFGGSYGNWLLLQYGLFGMTIFMAFLVYLIVQFKAFNIKLLATQALVVGLVVLIGSQFFFVRNPVNIVLTGVTLVLTIGFGYLLIKSVKSEVAQRERIERLAGDLAKANDGLFAANLKLKELDKQKTEFVSIASHQLRSPLTAIKGYSSMMLEGTYGTLGEKLQQPIQNIYDSSQRLVTIIEDFLNITRIELGRMKYEFATLNFKELAEKVVNDQQSAAKQKEVALNYHAEGGEYTINADSGKISQVISNLIDNAIKYTSAGAVDVTVSDGKGVVRLAVKDSGVGIPAELMSKLFEKFVRADDAGKINYAGTGLGLYVAKQMVEAHKGKIWAESDGRGKGSTFIVELPAKKG